MTNILVDWFNKACAYQENHFAIIRQFGNQGFEWIADDSDDDMLEHESSIPTGYLASGRVNDFPLWKGNVFITSNLERLYRMWRKCQKDEAHHYRIVKLNLSVEPVNHELIEAQMKIVARDEVLAKLSEEDREIILGAG